MNKEKNIEVIEHLTQCILDEVAVYKVYLSDDNTVKQIQTLSQIDDLVDTLHMENKNELRRINNQGYIVIG